MSRTELPPPPVLGSAGGSPAAAAELAARLRDALRRARFTEDGVCRTLGLASLPACLALRDADRPRLLGAAGGDGPLDTLVRAFVLREPVPEDRLVRALGPAGDWCGAGLATAEGGAASALVQICPLGDVLAAADWPGESFDEVMGVTASTRALAQLAVRRPADAALDLGTGSGVQAILAAAHCGRVVATDTSARALAFARFNAALNGVRNVAFAEGDGVAAVRGARFGLVLCNPPFRVAPEARHRHSDGGLAGDAFCRRMVREAPEVLARGGVAQILCNWLHPAGGDWRRRVGAWLDGLPCGAWALEFRSEDAESYVRERVREMPAPPPGLAEIWRAHLAALGAEGVGFGLVALRRGAADVRWARCESAPDATRPCGEAILRGLEAREFLETHAAAEALLASRVRAAPDLRPVSALPSPDGAAPLPASRLRIEAGLVEEARFDPAVAEFVDHAAERTLGEHLAAIAARAGRPAAEVRAVFLATVARLLELGFLVPEL